MAVQELWRLVNTFHKEHTKKPMATSPLIDSAPLMARPIAKPRTKDSSIIASTKQKRDISAKANETSKCAKKS